LDKAHKDGAHGKRVKQNKFVKSWKYLHQLPAKKNWSAENWVLCVNEMLSAMQRSGPAKLAWIQCLEFIRNPSLIAIFAWFLRQWAVSYYNPYINDCDDNYNDDPLYGMINNFGKNTTSATIILIVT
jgi:hypothetical protein